MGVGDLVHGSAGNLLYSSAGNLIYFDSIPIPAGSLIVTASNQPAYPVGAIFIKVNNTNPLYHAIFYNLTGVDGDPRVIYPNFCKDIGAPWQWMQNWPLSGDLNAGDGGYHDTRGAGEYLPLPPTGGYHGINGGAAYHITVAEYP